MSHRLVIRLLSCACAYTVSLSADGAEFVLVPKSITGAGSIVAQDVTLEGAGQQVTIHIEMSGWDPDLNGTPVLGAFQAAVDPDGYDNGSAVSLVPLGWPATPADGAFQAFNLCTINSLPDQNGAPCQGPADCPGEFCISNQRWVYNAIASVSAVATASLVYEYAASAQSGGRVEDGSPWYGGTLILDVPPGASGTYSIGLLNDPNSTFMRDANALAITPLDFIPVQITVLCQTAADCNDGNLCTDDACLANGLCSNLNNYDDQTECCNPATGAVVPLDDGNPCSAGSCNAETGQVTQVCLAAGTLCGDPPVDACDAQDTCDGNCNCIDRKAPAGTSCGNSANTECTDPDTCDGTGVCEPNHVVPGTPCGDGSDTTCTDPDTCNSVGTCAPNHASNGTPCDDGAFCTTGESCATGVCAGGSFTCDDGVACTDDACDEALDVCSNNPNDVLCNNGQFCDGVEICDPLLGCVVQAGSVPDCNDLVNCTVDSCDEINDVCVNAPNDGFCNNGQFCDGLETCDPDFDCQPGVAPNCNDGINCTLDSCNETNDVCVNAPDDGLCPDDGLFCNGTEVCVSGVGCDHTGSPCGGPCDEEFDICLCEAPLVTAAGSRYLAVSLQPANSEIPQAIVVRGACAGATPRYVGAPVPFYNEGIPGTGPMSMAGLLVDDPADAVFLTPQQWGDPVYITGETLAPGSTFDVWADCGSPGNPGFSESSRVLTYRFGDVDGNAVRNFADVQFCLLAFQGHFDNPNVSRASTDQHNCVPNLLPNINDAIWSIFGFQQETFADLGCFNECPPCHPADCDDRDACTVDSCIIENGTCLTVLTYNAATECCDPDTGATLPIDDGDPCTNDVCQPSTGGVTHNPLVCEDIDPCTVDECIGGACVFTPFTAIACDTNADCPPTSTGCQGMSACTCPGTPAPLIEWVPVDSTGPFSINNREIIIPQGGVEVTFEIFISDWAPRKVRVFQARILGATSYTSGTAGSLWPVTVPAPSDGAFIDTDRADFIFRDPFQNGEWLTVIGQLESDPTTYAWAGLLLPNGAGQTDTGVPRYAGTLVLTVSPDAAGTFAIEFNPDPMETFLTDEQFIEFSLLAMQPGFITVSAP